MQRQQELPGIAMGRPAFAQISLTVGECDCACHHEAGLMIHCMPCCSQCPVCKLNIEMAWLGEHQEACAENRAKFLRQLKCEPA